MDSEDLAQLLCRELLGRAPAAGEADGAPEEIVRRLALSREAITLGADRFAALRAKPLAKAMGAGRLILISLGPQCATAAILTRLGLRRRSFPFDWLFSSLRMVDHCLEDDFRTLLDPAEHETVPLDRRPSPGTHRTHHRLYRSFGIEHVFNHHEMPESLPHFERTVERFRTAPNPVFLHIARGAPDPDELSRVRARLRGPLLAFQVTPGSPATGFAEHDGVIAFSSHGDLGARGFQDKADEIAFAAYLTEAVARLPVR